MRRALCNFVFRGLRSTAAKCQQEPTSKDTNTVKSIFRLYVTDGLALYYDYPPDLVFGLTFEHLTATLIHSLIWYPHTDELKSRTAFFKITVYSGNFVSVDAPMYFIHLCHKLHIFALR